MIKKPPNGKFIVSVAVACATIVVACLSGCAFSEVPPIPREDPKYFSPYPGGDPYGDDPPELMVGGLKYVWDGMYVDQEKWLFIKYPPRGYISYGELAPIASPDGLKDGEIFSWITIKAEAYCNPFDPQTLYCRIHFMDADVFLTGRFKTNEGLLIYKAFFDGKTYTRPSKGFDLSQKELPDGYLKAGTLEYRDGAELEGKWTANLLAYKGLEVYYSGEIPHTIYVKEYHDELNGSKWVYIPLRREDVPLAEGEYEPTK